MAAGTIYFVNGDGEASVQGGAGRYLPADLKVYAVELQAPEATDFSDFLTVAATPEAALKNAEGWLKLYGSGWIPEGTVRQVTS